MLEYDVNGYHIKVNRMYTIVDGKEVDIDLTPVNLEFTVTEETRNPIISKFKTIFKKGNITEINQSVINGSNVIMSSGDIIVKEKL